MPFPSLFFSPSKECSYVYVLSMLLQLLTEGIGISKNFVRRKYCIFYHMFYTMNTNMETLAALDDTNQHRYLLNLTFTSDLRHVYKKLKGCN